MRCSLRWILIALISLSAAAWAQTTSVGSVDLRGVVSDEKGAPAAGVTAYVIHVSPREGNGFSGPYYPDWGKKALTDAEGQFVIMGVDGEMRFSLLFAAEGHPPVRMSKVDPSKEVKAKLKAMPEERKEAGRQIRGRVTDGEGKPVWGAEVAPTGWGSSTHHTYGQAQGVDVVTVTNDKGEFVITSKDLDVARDVRIMARGFAPQLNNLQPPGEEVHEYALTKGARILGRIVKDGKGLPGVAMTAVQTKRNSETFLGVVEVKADDQGGFEIDNLKPDEEYCVVAKGKSLPEGICTPINRWKTMGEGETLDAGDIEAVAGHTVSGKVKLSDGKPMPAGSSVILSRDGAWDSETIKLEKDGKFAFKGVAPETVQLIPRVKGYKPSADNASYEAMNGYALLGKVDDDISDLVVLVEPGSRTFDGNGGARYHELKEQRLQGASEDAGASEGTKEEKK